jgi:hypothetical protein
MKKPQKRGRPKSPHQKSQFNIRLPEQIGDCLSNNDRFGALYYVFKKRHPAGWSYVDPTATESPKKKYNDDYSKKSKRAAWGWNNSNMIAWLIDDTMRYVAQSTPELLIEYQELYGPHLPQKYNYLAWKQYKELYPEEKKDE